MRTTNSTICGTLIIHFITITLSTALLNFVIIARLELTIIALADPMLN